MNILSIVYVLYFLITVSIIHLTARILSKTSLTILLEVFHGDRELTLLVDRVIIASFFLTNVGFVVANVPTFLDHVTPRQSIGIVFDKLGAAMLFIGFTLFLGLWVVARMRRPRTPAPLPLFAPDAVLRPASTR
jgi:hypothetical protein